MVSELSIIIPTLNEEKYLPKLLNSILDQNFQGKLQVIIVDGHSKDKTLEAAKSYKDKIKDLLILRTGKGVGHQRNRGAKIARYEHIVFIDADMILPKNFLNKFTKDLNPNQKIIHVPIYFPIPGISFVHLAYYFAGFVVVIFSFFSPATPGQFIFTTKKNHLEIGGFKEGVVAGEDIDYGERSIKNGANFKIHYNCFVLTSVRRAKKMGAFNLILFYLKTFIYYKMHGVPYDKKKFKYSYGDY